MTCSPLCGTRRASAGRWPNGWVQYHVAPGKDQDRWFCSNEHLAAWLRTGLPANVSPFRGSDMASAAVATALVARAGRTGMNVLSLTPERLERAYERALANDDVDRDLLRDAFNVAMGYALRPYAPDGFHEEDDEQESA